ncbi:spore cortex-lytic enzyme [Paramaledivibacter caminithermalis]|uniref:Spore cortex-lytic enzyme n=1 Tax=Paramaledivibacter caminithermalis (strain DSM 15212 / CIP 107654 / DViRD3) TaxID=1121301 RepID=A0A1M6KGS4_PARC5|nr:spore cortex-lytic enzyme [Paramaledivibacter caminithermalis]SHJ58118.1 N-acetylmuramoyl-L-alanine amidase [Paramaledivibacter caminithermalis DSM 15212]
MKKITAVACGILIVIFSISIFAMNVYFSRALAQETLYWGSRGNEVRLLQETLKRWGYYDGPIDSVYGGGTFTAVKEFQRKNGLAVDGVVGPQTAKALGLRIDGNKPDTGKTKYTSGNKGISRNDDITLLAKAITGEARGEPYIGQVAVGAVILNRVKSPTFPNTIAGVIYQPGAFTAVSDGQINLAPADSCLKAARDSLNGWDPTYGSLYYWNPATATSKWIWSRKVSVKIGKHWFGN